MLRTALAAALVAGGAMIGMASDAQAQQLVPCARENGFCRVPYPARVLYGVPGREVELFVRDGGIPCSNRVFGDPAPGAPKRCAYVARRPERGDRRWDDRRGPPRGYDRGYRDRDYDQGYERPYRSYDYY